MFTIQQQQQKKKHIKADIWIYRNNKAIVLLLYCKVKILTIIFQYKNINNPVAVLFMEFHIVKVPGKLG